MKKNNTNTNTNIDISTKIVSSIKKLNSKTIGLKPNNGWIGNGKYFPSFSKEWKNIIYSFNKNNIKNVPVNHININKIIQSYFNLLFKNSRFLGLPKTIRLKERRLFLRKIYISDADIKHTNDNIKITLYAINREKRFLKNKFTKLYKKMSLELLQRYFYLYKNYILYLYSYLNNKYIIRNEYFFFNSVTPAIAGQEVNKNYIKHKLNYLGIFLILNKLLLKKIWSYLIQNQCKSYIKLLRKYNLLYSLNQFKLNKLILLPKLSNVLNKIIGKKIHYNIINLKSIAYNTDLFTRILALKIKKVTKRSHVHSMLAVVNKAYLPKVNTIQERGKIETRDNLDIFLNKYKNLNIVSNIYAAQAISKNNNITNLLRNNFPSTEGGQASTYSEPNQNINNDNIHNLIYTNIRYKNMGGIQIEVKGRLTKRYRADRSVFSLRRKGGLKNIDSSFKRLSAVLFRGNTKANTSYSIMNSKRRIGAFAVKGWISGK